jgi:hypothetical protein
MMNNGNVVFAKGVFNRLGEARLKATGHIRLTGEYEEVFPGLLGACRQAERKDHQGNEAA